MATVAETVWSGRPERVRDARSSREVTMGGGSPERVPGALFRALAALFLRGHSNVSQGPLAWDLGRRLASGGIHYHLRTLTRQLRQCQKISERIAFPSGSRERCRFSRRTFIQLIRWAFTFGQARAERLYGIPRAKAEARIRG